MKRASPDLQQQRSRGDRREARPPAWAWNTGRRCSHSDCLLAGLPAPCTVLPRTKHLTPYKLRRGRASVRRPRRRPALGHLSQHPTPALPSSVDHRCPACRSLLPRTEQAPSQPAEKRHAAVPRDLAQRTGPSPPQPRPAAPIQRPLPGGMPAQGVPQATARKNRGSPTWLAGRGLETALSGEPASIYTHRVRSPPAQQVPNCRGARSRPWSWPDWSTTNCRRLGRWSWAECVLSCTAKKPRAIISPPPASRLGGAFRPFDGL